jgi:hypothetical protein
MLLWLWFSHDFSTDLKKIYKKSCDKSANSGRNTIEVSKLGRTCPKAGE